MKRLLYMLLIFAPCMVTAQDTVVVPRSWLADMQRRLERLESRVNEQAKEGGGYTYRLPLNRSESSTIPMQRLPDGEHGQAGFGPVSTSLWYHVTNNYDAVSLYKFGIDEHYDLAGKDVNMNVFDVLARTNSTAPHLVYLRGLRDVKVAVSSSATAGYLGRTSTTGVLWATDGIHYALADSDNAVQLSHEDLTTVTDTSFTAPVVPANLTFDTLGLGHVLTVSSVDLSAYFLTLTGMNDQVVGIVTNIDHGALQGLTGMGHIDHDQYWIIDDDSTSCRGHSIGAAGRTSIVINLDLKTLVDNSNKTALHWGSRELRGTDGITVDAEWGQLGALDVQGDLYVSHSGAFYIGVGTAWTNTWNVGAGGDFIVNVPDQVKLTSGGDTIVYAGDDLDMDCADTLTINAGGTADLGGDSVTLTAGSTDILLDAADDIMLKPAGNLEVWNGASYSVGQDIDSGNRFKHGILVGSGLQWRKITVVDALGGTNITGYVLWEPTTLVP